MKSIQDVIEALKIEDDVLAQIERVCGRQLHRLSVEHDVLQRMLQSMPEEEDDESEQSKEISEDFDQGTCPEEETHKVVKVVSTKTAGAKRKPARGKKSSPSPRQTKEKKSKVNKGSSKRINAKSSTPSFDKTKGRSRRKKP